MSAAAGAGAAFLHVANGTATTRLIEAAGIPGRTSIWADPLYEGPVPGGLSDDELMDVRARHLAGDDTGIDPVNDLRRWREVIARFDAWDELVLWYEHDLFDQLNVIQLLTWIAAHVPASKPVSLVCVNQFPGRSRFRGLGELTPADIASLLPQRTALTATQYRLAERAWQAFREPTPESLDRLRRDDTAALPFLAAALTRFLQELPWTTDGLSRTERRLLRLAGAGPIALPDAFPRMHDGEDAYYVTDLSLRQMAADLSGTVPPLATFASARPIDVAPLSGTVALTESGREVLEGSADRVALCGLDRWFGGAYLQSGRSVWRWNDEGNTVSLARA